LELKSAKKKKKKSAKFDLKYSEVWLNKTIIKIIISGLTGKMVILVKLNHIKMSCLGKEDGWS